MHQLVDIDEIKQLTNVKSKHLKVEYNYETGKLIYDRLDIEIYILIFIAQKVMYQNITITCCYKNETNYLVIFPLTHINEIYIRNKIFNTHF